MNTRTVFQLGVDGVCLGAATAYESPLESGLFHVPAGCVEIAPPFLQAGQAAVWSDNSWRIVADHRGETWFRGRVPVTIDFAGDPSEQGLTSCPPTQTLAEMRSAKLAAISAAADALLVAGASVEGGLHIALDDGSRADLTAMAATATAASAGATAWPESYSRGWITTENIRIPLATPAQGLALAASVGTYYAAIVQHRRDLKDAALAAEDEAALATIDVAAGWPIAQAGGA